MNKIVLVAGSTVFSVVIGVLGSYDVKDRSDTQQMKYVDIRLCALELQQGIERKITLLREELVEAYVVPTDKGLMNLIQAITILRVYGADSKKAKEDIVKIVYQLKSTGFQNKTLLKKLDDLSKSSHVVSA